ncbi:hypothetical protein RFI_26480, partial [Reticulomyxa filosa]
MKTKALESYSNYNEINIYSLYNNLQSKCNHLSGNVDIIFEDTIHHLQQFGLKFDLIPKKLRQTNIVFINIWNIHFNYIKFMQFYCIVNHVIINSVVIKLHLNISTGSFFAKRYRDIHFHKKRKKKYEIIFEFKCFFFFFSWLYKRKKIAKLEESSVTKAKVSRKSGIQQADPTNAGVSSKVTQSTQPTSQTRASKPSSKRAAGGVIQSLTPKLDSKKAPLQLSHHSESNKMATGRSHQSGNRKSAVYKSSKAVVSANTNVNGNVNGNINAGTNTHMFLANNGKHLPPTYRRGLSGQIGSYGVSRPTNHSMHGTLQMPKKGLSKGVSGNGDGYANPTMANSMAHNKRPIILHTKIDQDHDGSNADNGMTPKPVHRSRKSTDILLDNVPTGHNKSPSHHTRMSHGNGQSTSALDLQRSTTKALAEHSA